MDSQTWGKKTKEEGWGGINLEFGINRYRLLFIKQITNKDLLYSTENYIQYLTVMKTNLKKSILYIYIYMNHFAIYPKHCK